MILTDPEIEDMVSSTFANNSELTETEYSMIRATEKAVANKIFVELLKAFDWPLPKYASHEEVIEHKTDQDNLEYIKQIMKEYDLKIPL